MQCCNEEAKQEKTLSPTKPVVNSTQRDYMAGRGIP